MKHSNALRFNITIPFEMGQRLKQMKNISGFIAEAVREKLRKDEELARRKSLAQAYRNSAYDEKGLTQDWDVTGGDVL